MYEREKGFFMRHRSVTDLRIIIIVAIIVVWRYGSGCDESLPQREEPARVFTATVSGVYLYRIDVNAIGVTLNVVNTFDETLQARLSIDGNVDIQWNRSPEYRVSIPLSKFTLIHSGIIDQQTRILTLDPGDSLIFYTVWDLVTDDTVFIPGMFDYNVEQTCLTPTGSLKVSKGKETFDFSGSVKIMDRTGYTIISQSHFDLCYYATYYVEPKQCPGNLAGMPCP
jgi:hypothetical protein